MRVGGQQQTTTMNKDSNFRFEVEEPGATRLFGIWLPVRASLACEQVGLLQYRGTARSFWKAPPPDLHRAAFHLCLPALRLPRGTGWPPGQPLRPPAHRLSWGQDNPEPNIVVPVGRVVVVAVR